MMQQEPISRDAFKLPKVYHQAKQLQMQPPLSLGHMGEFSSDVRLVSVDGNAVDFGVGDDAGRGVLQLHDDADDEDDYDYYGDESRWQHDADNSSRLPLARDLQATPKDSFPAHTSAIVHNWINYFTPRELVSVNAECSIFSPGCNWPGNVNLKRIEVECQYTRNALAAQNTLASLVLRAEAEQAYGLVRALPGGTLNPAVVGAPGTRNQTQGNTNTPPASLAPNFFLQGIMQTPPSTTASHHAAADVSSSHATKRPRSNPEKSRASSHKAPQATAAISPAAIQSNILDVDSDAVPPVVDVHVPSFCECGAPVVGVWYNKKPHYCQWFRQPRYAALRKLLEQNRCKSKCVSSSSCNAFV